MSFNENELSANDGDDEDEPLSLKEAKKKAKEQKAELKRLAGDFNKLVKDYNKLLAKHNNLCVKYNNIYYSNEKETKSLRERLDQAITEKTRSEASLNSLDADYKKLNQRLDDQMRSARNIDREIFSVVGTDSEPDRIQIEFDQFGGRLADLVRDIRKAIRPEDDKDYVARGTSKLSELIFREAAISLCLPTNDRNLVSSEVIRLQFCKTMEIAVEKIDPGSFHEITEAGFQTLRRVFLSTAPQKPGLVVFVQKGILFDINRHIAWPGSPQDEGSTVDYTVYPGYSVGSMVYSKPYVKTLP